MSRRPPPPQRPRRRPPLGRRVAPLVVIAGVALGVGIVVGADSGSPERDLVKRYVAAWERGDYATMRESVTGDDRDRLSAREFTDAYRRAAATATLVRLRFGAVGKVRDGAVTVPAVASTRAFGTVRTALRLPLDGSGDGVRVQWGRYLTFPGVPKGQRLERSTEMPDRADLLARDGTPLAQGPDRSSGLGLVSSAIVGQLGEVPDNRAGALRSLGYPDDAKVGLTGLERVFDARLAGKPGGVLRAGKAILASSPPRKGSAVRTSIDPKVQQAAVQSLGSQLGGVAAIRPRTGEILALAGIAFSGLQPPGSTFKIITLTGALEAKTVAPGATFPVETGTQIEGVDIANADNEACGGTLRNSFAHSCNSVFAPLGAKLGAQKLVETAERFGFNSAPPIPGAATSTIPGAEEIGDSLAVGSSAIGQGRVQATALQMGLVAATIGGRGRRPVLTLEKGKEGPRKRVVPAGVARTVTRFMEAVVDDGTGVNAQIPGVRIAGKTGTAELRDAPRGDCVPTPEAPCSGAPDDPTDTDAWFAAFAPVAEPKVAVGVLLVQAGRGGDTAAPIAKSVIQAAL